jgi:D-serine dehydratase
MKPVSFTVDNADQLFSIYAAAFPNLAGVNAGTGVAPGSFDWGLPFFFNRTVYVLFAGQTVSGTTGPAVGF